MCGTCHRELEELRRRLSQSNGAASNGSFQKAEREADERVSAAEVIARQAEGVVKQAEAKVRQAEADTAAAQAAVNSLRGAPPPSHLLLNSWWGLPNAQAQDVTL